MTPLIVVPKRAQSQAQTTQTIERKPPTRELSIPAQREILYRWDYTAQMPGDIARGLRLSRRAVDAVLKTARTGRGPVMPAARKAA